MIIKSRYTYLADGTVAENIAITAENSAIRAIGPASGAKGDVIDLGDALLLPGFVNAHTHLELGFAAERVPPDRDFVNWLRRLMRLIRETPQDQFSESVRKGLSDSLSAGVTTIADITRQPQLTRSVISDVETRPTAVSFGEVIAIGKSRDAAEARLNDAASDTFASSSLGIGISPHAPYTVESNALTQCADRTKAQGLRLCIHAAETLEELQFTSQHKGELRDFLIELGVWDVEVPPIGTSPIEYIDRCGALGDATLLAHCNYVDDSDIALIRDRAAHVAYCPRTHAAFEHSRHPLEKMLNAGINLCIGTDSLASNPGLSILEEIRFAAARHPNVSPETLINMATRNGATALGLETGTIEIGKRADLIAIPVDATSPTEVLSEVINNRSKVCFVCTGGQIALRD